MRVALKTVNACIQFVPALDGKALFTVEDLRQPDGALHPVQQAMVDCHGSQCGFCTPGFVMSLWALYLEHQAARNPAERPGASQRAHRQPLPLHRLSADPGGRRAHVRPAARVLRSRRAAPAAAIDRARRPRWPIEHDGRRFFAPRTVAELTELRAAHPQRDHPRRQHRRRPVGDEAAARPSGDHLHRRGRRAQGRPRGQAARCASAPARRSTDAYRALARHYPELTEMWERFASPPIRNAGTMGGNVANGSPIGDSMPGLIALGATRALAQPRALAHAAAGGSLRRLHEEGDGGGRDSRGDRRAAAAAGAAVPHLQAVEALRFRHFRRLRGVCDRARRRPHRAHAGSPSAAWRRRRKRASATEARARRPAVDRGDGARGDGGARRRLRAADRHAGERRLPAADRAESAVPVLSRDAAATIRCRRPRSACSRLRRRRGSPG